MVQLKNEVIESSSIQDNVEGMKTGASSLAVESVFPITNHVLQKLLRGPRYFDSPKRSSSCSSSDEEYSRFTKRKKAMKKQKICHYCGANHSTTNCKQIRRKFIFTSKGQLIKRQDNDSNMDRASGLCLKCGDAGHDMFSCCNGYDSRDLKEARCYVCKEYGHLCCANSRTEQEVAISCYNCGLSGHDGPECPELKEVSLPCSNSEPRDQSLTESNKNPEDNPTVITTEIKDAALSGKKARRARHRKNKRAAKKLFSSIANQQNIGNNSIVISNNATEANQPTNVGPPESLSPARNRQQPVVYEIPQIPLQCLNSWRGHPQFHQEARGLIQHTMWNARGLPPPPRQMIMLPLPQIHPSIWNNGQRPTWNVIQSPPRLPFLVQGNPQSGHSPAFGVSLPHQFFNTR